MDRFQICLGYYWYMAYGYADYQDSCDIHRRLQAIQYKPAPSDEYSAAMHEPHNVEAHAVFTRLVSGGYR